MAELCAYLLRNIVECKEVAKKLREPFAIIESVPLDIAIRASELRHRMRRKGKRWSYVDSIGYVLAKSIGARFLTGDKEFEGVEDVEFIV